MFSKPHMSGREEDRLGRDLALCESKQKSLGTMNNKSIQKKKSLSFEENSNAGGEQLLAKRGLALMHCGCWATQQAAPAKVYMQSEADTVTTKQNEFPQQGCGCWVTVEPSRTIGTVI